MVKVRGLDGSKREELKLPEVFQSDLRPDIVRFVYSSIRSNLRLPYYEKTLSGHEYNARSLGNNKAMARTPRIVGVFSRRSMAYSGECSMCRGGQVFSSTRIWRRWHVRTIENLKKIALSSALACSGVSSLIQTRGHLVDCMLEIPIVVSNVIQKISSS